MSPHAARFDEALSALGLMVGWWGGWLPVRLGSWTPQELLWRQGPAQELPSLVRWLDTEHDEEIRVGLPQTKPWNGGVGQASVLWCRIEGAEQLRRARAFNPRPSLVLQEGTSSRRWLIWALREVVSYFALSEANRKLAYALHATQRWGDPDEAWFPAPGTCMREGRSRPVPVRVGRLTTADFTVAQIVGRLREPPPKDAWMDAAGIRR